MLALAQLHAQAPAPERTVVFLAVTAEESGLLGSQWYAQHPVYPIAGTVANINMDNMNTVGRTRDADALKWILKNNVEFGRTMAPQAQD